MHDQILVPGGAVTVTVTKSLPFGVLVEYANVAGLARGVDSAPGAKLKTDSMVLLAGQCSVAARQRPA